jgi:hypothetical protein
MSGICRLRLAEERKQWRKDHPFVRVVSYEGLISWGSGDLCLFPALCGTLASCVGGEGYPWMHGEAGVAQRRRVWRGERLSNEVDIL